MLNLLDANKKHWHIFQNYTNMHKYTHVIMHVNEV